MARITVDHVLYAVTDLDEAAERLADELGLEAGEGGSHPAWGTANRIVRLGCDYLELIGVVDPERAAASDFGRLIADAVRGGDRVVGWAVATDDIDAVAERLGLDVQRGSRTRTDRVRLTWRLAGVDRAVASGGALPFFIQWDGPPALHPGGEPSAPPGIAWVEVGERWRDELATWLGGAEIPLRFGAGAGIVAVGIGDTVLR